MKKSPKPVASMKRAEPCSGIVYRGFNVKAACELPRGHRGSHQ